MKFFVSIFVLICAMSIGQAHATQATPTGGSGGSLGYTCTNNEGQTASCSCVGLDDCKALNDSGLCKLQDGTNIPDITCTPGIRNCSCDWNQLEGDAFGWRPESQSPGTNMAPADEALSPRERRNRYRASPAALPQDNRTRRDHRSGSNTDDNEAEDDSETVPARRGQPRPRTTLPDPD